MKALFFTLVFVVMGALPGNAAPSIYGTWVVRQGAWPDSAEVKMTIGKNQTRFLTQLTNAGVGCTIDITVATAVDSSYFHVLQTVRKAGRGFMGCEGTVTAQRATYTIRGNTLTLQNGFQSTTYTRLR